jgi:hypothetical protein
MCSPQTKLSIKTNVSSLNPFSWKIQIFKGRVKVPYFYKTWKIFNNFSRENYGHGGNEHGVCRGVFMGKLPFKMMSAGGRLCTLQKTPHFWVQKIKVRPPNGIIADHGSRIVEKKTQCVHFCILMHFAHR